MKRPKISREDFTHLNKIPSCSLVSQPKSPPKPSVDSGDVRFFPTDRFGGRRVKIPSKITEFTFFWPETGQHTIASKKRICGVASSTNFELLLVCCFDVFFLFLFLSSLVSTLVISRLGIVQPYQIF